MSGIQMTLLGAGGRLDTQTITVQDYVDKLFYFTGYRTGYMGSISDGTFNPTGGTTISGLYYNVYDIQLIFTLSASPISDAGWTTMTLNGTAFTRSSASFFSSGGSTSWTWSSVSPNPFPAAGNTTTAVFT
jgi:hypothetical protein